MATGWWNDRRAKCHIVSLLQTVLTDLSIWEAVLQYAFQHASKVNHLLRIPCA